MNRLVFYVAVPLVLFWMLACGGGVKAPVTAREAADLYVEMARKGDVKAVENLSTERYRRRAENEVGRFKGYSACAFTRVDMEEESEGTWHACHYTCQKNGGGTEEIIVAVLEKDGKFLVGDID